MELVGKKLNSLQQEDSFDVFGKHIANKLRSVNRQQNIFAQKLINNVLFEAEMDTLTRSFKVVDLGEPQYHFGGTGGSYEWQPRWQEHIPPQTVHQQQNIPSHVLRQHQNVPPAIVYQQDIAP